MLILSDMDGVLADTNSHIVEMLNRYHGENLKPEDIKGWGIEDYCQNAKKEDVQKFFRQSGFFRHLKPIPGALEGLRHLMVRGYDVVIVTACQFGYTDKRDWLTDHLPEFDAENNMIVARRKELIHGDVLIDDGVHNLEPWAKEHPDGMPICYAQPYNTDFDGERAESWPHVIQQIENFRINRMQRAMSNKGGK